METIADSAGCSRPLVYKHYASTAEVMLALALESKERRVLLYERALAFRNRPRERALAVSEVERILEERDLSLPVLVPTVLRGNAYVSTV